MTINDLMKKIHLSLLWAFFFCISYSTQGNAKPALTPKNNIDSAEVSGQIIGRFNQTDSVHIILLREVIFDKLGALNFQVPIDYRGRFHVKLPMANHTARLILYLTNFETIYLDRYLIDPCDKINIVINKNDSTFTFSGKGSAKFSCKNTLDKDAKSIQPYIDSLEKEPGFWGVDNSYKRIAVGNKLIYRKMNILNRFKNELSLVDYKIIKADILGEMYVTWSSPVWSSWFMADSLKRKKVVHLYQQLLSNKPDTSFGNILALSPYYIHYLFIRSAENLLLEKHGNSAYAVDSIYLNSGSFRALYHRIKGDYRGILREKILLQLLLNNMVQINNDVYDSCLSDAIPLICTNDIKTLAENMLQHKRTGAKAFNFMLPDTAGNVISLNSLKGKVVFIDIWFTGCHACLGMAREIDKNVYPQFKDNPNITFVSISMDVNKDQWLKSFHEGKYTSKNYINLYTDGQGINHPFLKYYNVQGGPTLMVIDKNGRIFSSAPPMLGESSALVSLLKTALASK